LFSQGGSLVGGFPGEAGFGAPKVAVGRSISIAVVALSTPVLDRLAFVI
jgi:hypothetical protein